MLREARGKRRKTQREIADECGVTQPTVSEWESGKSSPRPSLWALVSSAYGISVAKLASAVVS